MTETASFGGHRGEVALVTGGNKGIGKEIVRQLAAEGMTVYLGARDAERGQAAAAELDGDVRHVLLDVTDQSLVDSAVKRIDADFGRLDVLVNNAGIAGELGYSVPEVSAAQLREVYEVNVFGVVAMTQACVPLLRKAATGRVVNMSSALASLTRHSDPTDHVSSRRLLAYNTSKTALNAVTVMYANALREEGILVNAVDPGLVPTDLNATMPERGSRTTSDGAEGPVALALLGAGGPSGTYRSTGGVLPW